MTHGSRSSAHIIMYTFALLVLLLRCSSTNGFAYMQHSVVKQPTPPSHRHNYKPRHACPLVTMRARRNQGGASSQDEHFLLSSWIRQAMATTAAGLLLFSTIVGGPCWAQEKTGVTQSMRYWDIMRTGPKDLVVAANEGLLDYAVGTVNTMYYDNSGGAYFTPQDFYSRWKSLKNWARDQQRRTPLQKSQKTTVPSDISMDSRDGAVKGLKWLVSTINDPFSKYLTREELRQELKDNSHGFLGLGAIVEPPISEQSSTKPTANIWGPLGRRPSPAVQVEQQQFYTKKKQSPILSVTQVANLPMVAAVSPDSPAERSGIVVGDRIVAVGSDKFLGQTRTAVSKTLQSRYSAENYIGHPEVTIAKPLLAAQQIENNDEKDNEVVEEVLAGYRLSRVRLPTTLVEPFHLYPTPEGVSSGGNSIVHYELLTPQDSIFDRSSSSFSATSERVGYIRLTRFSRASTAGYLEAIEKLEGAGAQSYIIDLRNNYGGIIQEAMLTASTLLRDPHLVLCYTMNNRGGFEPHEVAEYILDTRFPGYFLSSEPKSVTLNQVKRESPELFDKDNGIRFVPPSAYASLREQSLKRGIHRATSATVATSANQWNVASWNNPDWQLRAQKKLVILINEGTASSAEVFASALHDNGRTVALVGAKTYGKGLIQHTFPMPDGGGLRLTVAEYLTPTLQHVTHVGNARFDKKTGEWVGGGIRPDITCESKQGIPSNVGADLCVGVALDALEETTSPLSGGSI